MEELKWNKLKEKQPNIKQRVIFRNLAKDNSIYPIKYGTYYGIENTSTGYKIYFLNWFDSNFSSYGINSDIIWIPYPSED